MRQTRGSAAATMNGMRQNRTFWRQLRDGTDAAEPAVATQKRKIFRRKNTAR
jgi:hypothetical protein